MNKLLKLSTTALLLSGMAISGAAVAAVTFTAPTLRSDNGTVTVGSSITIKVSANDVEGSTPITKYTASAANYGTVSCAAGSCKYTSSATKGAGKRSDSFTYTVTYKNASGKLVTKSAVVNITLKPNGISK
jgi:hypothetical protein